MSTETIILIVLIIGLIVLAIVVAYLFFAMKQRISEKVAKITEIPELLAIKESLNDLKQNTKLDLTNLSNNLLTTTKDNIEKLQQALERINTSNTQLLDVDKKIENLNNIFYNTKQRGNLGEFLLGNILSNLLGENNKLWTTQAKLQTSEGNSGYVDAIIYTGKKAENIAIDAKFPLDNFKKIQQSIIAKEQDAVVKSYQNSFRSDINNKIKEVKKYISSQNEISNAILFIPSEAVFNYIVSEMQEQVETAIKDKVWLCSPTTLSIILHVIMQAQRDYQLSANLNEFKKQINNIFDEYRRFGDRWDTLKNDFAKINKDISNLDITIGKISSKTAQLNEIEIEDN